MKVKKNSNIENKDPIKWRGHEVTRMEAFSDSVFALAITLLIISLEVPKTYEELMQTMKGFLPFGVSFIIFFLIWLAQNLFFRRFGLRDNTTLVLNAMLLFMVLFFVYPLKFLWSAVFFPNIFIIKTNEQTVNLFYIYSGGFAVIYLLFTLMYAHAYRKREHLNLTPVEVFETRTHMYQNLVIALIGILSVIIASIGNTGLAWMVYPLIGPVIGFLHNRRNRVHRKLFMFQKISEPAPEGELKPENNSF